MIIKVKTSRDSGEWTLYADATDVSFDTTWQTLPDGEVELIEVLGIGFVDDFTFLYEEPLEGEIRTRERIVRWVRWTDDRHNMVRALITNLEPIYICNDEGKTIERV